MMFKTKGLLTGMFVSAAVLASALSAKPAHAVEAFDGKVEIHGYGDTTFVAPSKNNFLEATSQGDWKTETALLFTTKVDDKTSVWVQIFGSNEGFNLDWSFIDYRFNENFRVRGGQIKMPMGIYNEVRDAKFLQLTAIQPYIYQEGTDFTDEAFRGVSGIYNRDFAGGNIELNVFGGQAAATHDSDEKPENQILGGRVTYKTPIEGLSLMGSFKRGNVVDEEEVRHEEMAYIGSIDYVNNDLDLKAEYAHKKLLKDVAYAYYAQAGYTLFDKLTPYLRADFLTTDKNDSNNLSKFQQAVTFGAAYKFNNNVSFKVEDQIGKGYALSVISGGVAEGEGAKHWNIFATSLNFMF